MTEEKRCDLTGVEKELVKTSLNKLADLRSTLGIVREDFLSREKRVLIELEKEKELFMSRIRSMAESKEIPVDGKEWTFDISSLSFVKSLEKEE